MRIIAGKHKGRKLNSPEKEEVRVTADMVKQALFTKLQFFIADKRVLDLFAGSGSLGIEAISRGANEVVFADADVECVKIIKENLNHISEKAEVLCGKFESVLEKLTGRFDLIILDPPYNSGYYQTAMQIINEKNLLNDNGIIVCEHDTACEITTSHYTLMDSKRYGKKSLSYFTMK